MCKISKPSNEVPPVPLKCFLNEGGSRCKVSYPSNKLSLYPTNAVSIGITWLKDELGLRVPTLNLTLAM